MTPTPTEVEAGRTQSTAKIREVTPANRHDVATLADLHLRLLGHGPMARLGRVFLRDFCYTTLLQGNLMRAAIFEVDGAPAGFVAYTPLSITFHRTAIRGHFIRAGWCTLKSILINPKVLLSIPKALHLMFSRRAEQGTVGTDPSAEVVAIGVLPEYRNSRFIRETGIRVSHGILEYVKDYFRRAGLPELRMIVEAENRPTLLYYHSLGATFAPYEQAGEPMMHVRFDLRTNEGADVVDVPDCWVVTDGIDEERRDFEGGWSGYWATVDLPRTTINVQSDHFATRLRRTFAFKPDSRVLDFGCGLGAVADNLAPVVGEMWLWDGSPKMRAAARVGLAHHPNVRFPDLRASDADPPVRFDYIIVNSVIQYMSEDELRAWLPRWRRWLAPEGCLIISDVIPPEHSAFQDALALLRLSPRGFLAFVVNSIGHYRGVRTHTTLLELDRDRLRTLAKEVGLEVEVLRRNLTHFPQRFTIAARPTDNSAVSEQTAA